MLYWRNGLNKNRVGSLGFFFFFEELFLTEFIKHFISSAQCKSVVTFLTTFLSPQTSQSSCCTTCPLMTVDHRSPQCLKPSSVVVLFCSKQHFPSALWMHSGRVFFTFFFGCLKRAQQMTKIQILKRLNLLCEYNVHELATGRFFSGRPTGVASHTKPGHLIELKYILIFKIHRALDKKWFFPNSVI